MSAEKLDFFSSSHIDFKFAILKQLNHEWKETFDVNLDPFDATTFLCKVFVGEFILTSNHP